MEKEEDILKKRFCGYCGCEDLHTQEIFMKHINICETDNTDFNYGKLEPIES